MEGVSESLFLSTSTKIANQNSRTDVKYLSSTVHYPTIHTPLFNSFHTTDQIYIFERLNKNIANKFDHSILAQLKQQQERPERGFEP